ncbi:hypothetical protein [Variovorax sp. GT1P44]|uniref:hypothetical protein n=1 Tax=Variovorax sp. GT1P44 TaxID=3443742 RepID=UPI003F44E2D6
MKPDADPGRAREFEVLAILILFALAAASMADFLRAPVWPTLVDVSQPADDDELHGTLIEPWIPEVPDSDPPAPVHATQGGASAVAHRS